jgi:hypothetical protein
MLEVCQLIEAMTPEGRLAVIQRKQLCQFCFRHPDTQSCPSHSLPVCPIRECMHMHHRMLHRVRVEPELKEHGGEEDPQATGSEGPPPLTSDESEGRNRRDRACASRWYQSRQMV